MYNELYATCSPEFVDSDGDRITICSDEELGDALNNVQGPVLKLLVKTNSQLKHVMNECLMHT